MKSIHMYVFIYFIMKILNTNPILITKKRLIYLQFILFLLPIPTLKDKKRGRLASPE